MSVMTVQGESKTKSTIQRFDVLRVFLGIGLLVTAGLKAHGLVLDPVSQDSFLSSPRLQVAVIEIEILLGLWLLSGFAKRGAWWCALGFFGALAAASFYLGWEGQASCGCFGRVAVSPWVTFGVDVGLLIVLVSSRPPHQQPNDSTQPTTASTLFRISIVVVIMCFLITAGTFFSIQNPSIQLARLRGEFVSISPNVASIGEVRSGEMRETQIDVCNNSDNPIRIVGGTSDCSCDATADLPLVLQPRECKSIRVRVRIVSHSGRFLRTYYLYTDEQTQCRAVGRVIGQLVATRLSTDLRLVN